MIKKISLFVQAGFYVSAGINHFIHPEFYFDLIPDYLPYHEAINVISGIIEIMLGSALLFSVTRLPAAWLIIAMLISFIPSHVFFIMEGSCVDSLCVDPWVGWMRLFVIHPLLIFWAWSHRK